MSKRRGLAYDVPLGPGFTAQLILPYDMTAQEAARLKAFVASLVTPFSLAEGGGK